jgi:hypothetical protein
MEASPPNRLNIRDKEALRKQGQIHGVTCVALAGVLSGTPTQGERTLSRLPKKDRFPQSSVNRW